MKTIKKRTFSTKRWLVCYIYGTSICMMCEVHHYFSRWLSSIRRRGRFRNASWYLSQRGPCNPPILDLYNYLLCDHFWYHRMHTLLLGQRAEPITKVPKIISNLITVQKGIFFYSIFSLFIPSGNSLGPCTFGACIELCCFSLWDVLSSYGSMRFRQRW